MFAPAAPGGSKEPPYDFVKYQDISYACGEPACGGGALVLATKWARPSSLARNASRVHTGSSLLLHQLNRRVALHVLVALFLLPGPGRATEAPAPLVAPPENTLTVVSLNLALREDVDQIAAELSAAGIAQTADVLLLQEVLHRKPFDDIAVQLGEHLDFESVYREAFAIDDERSSGLAVLSRYPQHDPHVLNLRRFDLGFRSRSRIALGTWSRGRTWERFAASTRKTGIPRALASPISLIEETERAPSRCSNTSCSAAEPKLPVASTQARTCSSSPVRETGLTR